MADASYGNPAITDALHVSGSTLPWETVHSWMRDGHMQTAWSGEGKNVPPDGTEITLKIIAFPVGSVREIVLKTGASTHHHGSYEDVLFYQIGGRRVQLCQDESGTLDAGDVSFEPHGVDHSTYQLIGGPFVEFALPAPERSGSEARGLWIKASEAREIPCAVWDNGSAEGPDTYWAPSDAKRHTRHIFSVPGHDLIETRLPAGSPTAPRRDVHDTLFYVISGTAQVTIGDATFDAVAGDSLRAPAGSAYAFTATQDAVVIQAAARKL